jgi:hypothetical protein
MILKEARGEMKLLYLKDATFLGIVAEAIQRIKLAPGHFFVMPGLAKGCHLHHKNCDSGDQHDMHHAAFMKNNRQNEPNDKEYSRNKPEFHL